MRSDSNPHGWAMAVTVTSEHPDAGAAWQQAADVAGALEVVGGNVHVGGPRALQVEQDQPYAPEVFGAAHDGSAVPLMDASAYEDDPRPIAERVALVRHAAADLEEYADRLEHEARVDRGRQVLELYRAVATLPTEDADDPTATAGMLADLEHYARSEGYQLAPCHEHAAIYVAGEQLPAPPAPALDPRRALDALQLAASDLWAACENAPGGLVAFAGWDPHLPALEELASMLAAVRVATGAKVGHTVAGTHGRRVV